MSQIASHTEENLTTPLGKSKLNQNRMSNTNTDDKSRKELAKRNMNVESAQPSLSNLDENDFSYKNLGFLEELEQREDEIRKMLYESKPSTKTNKEVVQEKTNRKNIYADLTGHHSDDEECTFKPKINSKTKKLVKRQNSDVPINEILYKSALDKKAKEKEVEAEARQNASKMSNSNKISVNSMKIVFKRIETALRNLIHEVENPEHPEYLSFENLGALLQKLGVFKNLEFAQMDETHRSSVSVNQAKGKAQLLAREMAFHENLWKTLASACDASNLISSELMFRFLMVLFEDKASVAESSMVLQEIMNIGLEEKGITKDAEGSAFDKIKKEYILWDMDKLVTEFRKLFNDKTAFMHIYSKAGNLNRGTVDENQTFRPQINSKSKNLDLRNTGENYKSKLKANNEQLGSPDKLPNRFEMLFEYHKYLKERKNENAGTKVEQELANCTFKPQITEYKKKGGDQSSSLLYSSQDLSKAKRHDLLYDVARVQKEKQTQKAYEMKKQEETKQLSECTFQPRINAGSEDYSREQAVTGAPPKGYKKAVERMKVAERIRETKRAEREHVPRGENYEKLKNTNFKPPSFLSRPKTKKNDALVYVDVNIGPGKTGRIGIHRGDDARTLAKNFARTYSLPAVMRESLEKLLQTYIDSYFPEHEEEEEERGSEGEREEQEEDVLEEEHEEDEEDAEEHERHDEMREKLQNRAPVRENEEEDEEDEDEDDEDDEDDDLDLDQDDDDDDDDDEDDEEDATPVNNMRNQQQQRIPAKKI